MEEILRENYGHCQVLILETGVLWCSGKCLFSMIPKEFWFVVWLVLFVIHYIGVSLTCVGTKVYVFRPACGYISGPGRSCIPIFVICYISIHLWETAQVKLNRHSNKGTC